MSGATGETVPRFRLTAGASLLLLAVIAAVATSSCGKKPARHEEAGEAAEAAVNPAMTIDDRLANRPEWLDTADSLKAADFSEDPHTFACAVCHTRADKSEKEWKVTCSGSHCHFRPWPKTVMHRVELSVFNRCVNCHKPHVFRLDAGDCLSCHGDIRGPAGTVPVTKIEGVSVFPHGKHAGLACAACHSTETTHGGLTVESAATCRSCHHQPARAADCAQCHAQSAINGPRTVPFTMTIAGNEEKRRLPFDHEFHEGLDCANCHAEDASRAPKIACTDCHELHHDENADCVRCHQAPPPDVHPKEVHTDGCADCHGERGFPAMVLKRNFCEACHRDRTDHFPGRNCAGCHKMTASRGGER